MFKRRSKNKESQKRTSKISQQRMPVFSYHSSRSNTDSPANHERHSQQNTSKSLRNKHLAAGLFIFVLLAGFTFISTLSTQVNVRVFQADGSPLTSDTSQYKSELENLLNSSILNRSKFFIDAESIESLLKQKFPELGQVSLMIPMFGRNVTAHLAPERPAIILATSRGAMAVAASGRVIGEASKLPSSIRDNVPTIEDTADIQANTGEVAIPSDLVKFVQTVVAYLEAEEVAYKRLVFPAIANELHIYIEDNNYFVKFNTESDPRQQVGTYLLVRDKIAEQGRSPSEYIDVRIPERASTK